MSSSHQDIHAFLKQHEQKQLLRFVSVGSVDDGKSTLIGRLLHDTQGVYEDQLEDARSGGGTDGEIDFALITDGLAAEREQGITIDVAYRYFSTAARKFIIADTPGHVQYTRNMATGASTANVAIILIDARLGVLQQSRRHAYIASLLGIPHLLVAINKMDLVDYDEAVFRKIQGDFEGFLEQVSFRDVTYLPLSALAGDNVVQPSAAMPWFSGTTVLEYLETVDIRTDRNMVDLRYPVQTVIRPNQNYRGFAGQIASGTVAVGDEVIVYPSEKTSRIKAIDTYDGELEAAFAPMSVTLRLEDEIDISRGDMITSVGSPPSPVRTFDAHVVWMSEAALDPGKSYLIKHTTRYVRAGLHQVSWKLDMDTLEKVPSKTLALNDIGRVTVTCHRPLYVDPYDTNRATGAFVVIDTLTNYTVGAGMIIEPTPEKGLCSGEESGVSARERQSRLSQSPTALLLIGDGATLRFAYSLERELFDKGAFPTVISSPGPATAETYSAIDACLRAGLLTLCWLPEASVKNARRIVGEDATRVIRVGESALPGMTYDHASTSVDEKMAIQEVIAYLADAELIGALE